MTTDREPGPAAEDTLEGVNTDSDRKRHKTINDLPPDVLLVIFRELLLGVRRRRFWSYPLGRVGWNDRYLEPWPSYDSSMRKHPFPESVASVCRYWREVMSTVSFFWTRLVIWVGKEPTPLSTIRDYLAWSQDGLLDIYILSKTNSPDERDPTEKTQVKAVMETLAPHMNRWKNLYVELLQSSSLPLPRIDIVGSAIKLVKLELHYAIDDSVASTEAASPVIGEFHTPVLDELSMGGLQFRESYVKPFPQYEMPPELCYASIVGYDDSHHPPFPMIDLLACLTSCKKLHRVELANLRLDCSYTGPPIVPTVNDWDADVDFVDMPGDIIAEYNRLLDYPYVDSVSYTRCTMETPAPLGESYNLTMDGIASPTALLSFLVAVRGHYSCSVASFTNCDGLRSDILLMLAMPPPHANVWLCPHLRSLSIEGCTHFSSSDLRVFLQWRRSVHAASGFVEDGHPAFMVASITELDVEDCCELAPEDKQWFDENLESVRWDDWTGGTGYTF
ncbi:uncharacterized protein B0H18DRAFT_497192 [Fomitopsis serialis]|uniref:uncharacterized protein n=1 Tax=Fomitopsis serialis TaxID=139415 RepID=UPI0020082597|nr:uncharacterized protein B0H18DRAFT_497192 [Neoantrodia serialis]KAH9922914.1 hypothetical protein B0H18DRAFT_497192 [Neoantrodia serialis]